MKAQRPCAVRREGESIETELRYIRRGDIFWLGKADESDVHAPRSWLVALSDAYPSAGTWAVQVSDKCG